MDSGGRMERVQTMALTKKMKWVIGTIIALGSISSMLGFLAEAYRVKDSDIEYVDNECVYPNSPSLLFGVIAAVVLTILQIVVNVAGGCICCKQAPPPHSPATQGRSVAIVCLVACWITFINAFALLMAGASSFNNRHPEYMWFSNDCNVVKPLVFAGGALLAIATMVLGLLFYVASSATAWASGAQVAPHHIALGHPYPVYFGPPTQLMASGDPPYAVFGYPDVVTGYPKSIPANPHSFPVGAV